MSRRQSMKLSSDILDQATTWFVEFGEGGLKQTAREDFIVWLRTSPEHVRAYLQVSMRWEEAVHLRKSAAPGIDELMEMARKDDNVVPLEHQTRRSWRSIGSTSPLLTWRAIAIAATVLLAVGAATWLAFQRDTYATGIGEQRSIKLADGSSVELNSRSKIRIAFSANRRDVALLEGQALFRVEQDPLRPFVVSSDGTHIRAIGTQFDVYRKPLATVVTVVEGRVAVVAESSAVPNTSVPSTPLPAHAADLYLNAGEQLTVGRTTIERPPHPDIAAATAWTEKQIVFQNTPLTEVVEEFNRHNSRQLVIASAGIETMRISGVFSSVDSASILRGLDTLGAFSIRQTADRIEIYAK